MFHGQDSFIVYIKTENISSDIVEDFEIKFDSLNYELNKPLPKGKNKKVIGIIKDESDGKTDDNDEDKKPKNTKKCVVIRRLKFEDYKNYLKATQLENKINHLEKIILLWVIFQKIINNS